MKEHAKQMADSVYKELKAGADFGEMAKMYSNDKTTYMNRGLCRNSAWQNMMRFLRGKLSH